MKTLRSTYSDPAIHDNWRRIYRSDPRQLAFDEFLYDWLFRKLQPQGEWLDAGCGSGERTFMLAKRAGSALGIDISPNILEAARANAAALQLEDRVRFECSGLEELNAEAISRFRRRNVHFRGVLMHIPAWRPALENVCRCAESGGYVVVMESSYRSLEVLIVKLLRWMKRPCSRMVVTDGGLEFQSESEGKAFVVRMANVDAIKDVMRAEGVEPFLLRSTSVFDIARFPASLRPFVIWLNRLWCRGNLPFALGVVIVGKKA